MANVTFPTLLALLFIGLKLGGVITWPWLWVLAPLWLPIVVVITAFLVFGLLWAVGGGLYLLWLKITKA